MARGGRGRGRRRPGKGQTRMDAALDAMKPYGYSEELVVSTVNELLDVYGVEGWPFIEEASYTVLLNSIFEKDDKDDLTGRENETKASAAGSSTMLPLPSCSNQEIEFGSTVTRESPSEATEVPEIAKLTEASVYNGNFSNIEGEGSSSSKHTSGEQDHDNNQTNNAGVTVDGNFSGAKNVGISNSSQCPSQLGVGSEVEEVAFPTRSRRPYHGWISDSDEPLDLIQLKHAASTSLGISKKGKRRWDQLPQDVGPL